MKKFAAMLTAVLLILCLAACAVETDSDINAPLPDEMSFMELNAELVKSAPSTALVIIYGERFINPEPNTEIPCHELTDAANAEKIMLTAVADSTRVQITDDRGSELWSGNLDSGESVMFSIEIPEQGGCGLTLQKGESAAFSMEINRRTIDTKGWIYVVE